MVGDPVFTRETKAIGTGAPRSFGGGVRGGNIIGATDRTGSEVIEDRQTPESLAATIYQALGIPRKAVWPDVDGRPHQIYHGEAIQGLYS